MTKRSVAAGIALAAVAVVSLGIGHYPLTPSGVLDVLWSIFLGSPPPDEFARDVVVSVRAPRVLAAMLVGASLACAGAAYQTLFRNPLASPAILGVSAGAGFGAALAMLLQWRFPGLQISAFAGGLVAVWCAIGLSKRLGDGSSLVLILAGVVVSALFTALTSALKYVADPQDTLPNIVFWLLGGLGRVTLTDLAWASPWALAGIGVLFVLRWPTHVLETGDDEALSLGVNVARIRLALVVAATVITAAAVSISGIVGWVGLLVPHLARLIVGPAHPNVLPMSALLGAGYLLLVDDLCRSAFSQEVPIGIATAVIGAPVFVALLARNRRTWS